MFLSKINISVSRITQVGTVRRSIPDLKINSYFHSDPSTTLLTGFPQSESRQVLLAFESRSLIKVVIYLFSNLFWGEEHLCLHFCANMVGRLRMAIRFQYYSCTGSSMTQVCVRRFSNHIHLGRKEHHS